MHLTLNQKRSTRNNLATAGAMNMRSFLEASKVRLAELFDKSVIFRSPKNSEASVWFRRPPKTADEFVVDIKTQTAVYTGPN